MSFGWREKEHRILSDSHLLEAYASFSTLARAGVSNSFHVAEVTLFHVLEYSSRGNTPFRFVSNLTDECYRTVLGGSGLVRGGWKNLRKYRNRLCIMAEMLEIAKGGALKTPIMYKANLSFAQLNEYLSLLLEMGLLEAVNKSEKAVYKTTAKGLHYIQAHKKLTALIF